MRDPSRAGSGCRGRVGQRLDALTGLGQPGDQRRQRDIESGSSLLVGEFGENDDQKSFPELQREQADGRRRADPSRERFAVRALRILVPAWLPIVVGEAANMAAVKSN